MEYIIKPIAFTLLHSIWLGALAMLLYYFISKLIDTSKARLRYGIACILLVGFVSSIVLTFGYYYVDNSLNISSYNQLEMLFISGEVNADNHSFSIGSWFQNNLEVIVFAWSIGVIIMFLRLSGSLLYLKFLLKKSLMVEDDSWLNSRKRISKLLKLNSKVELKLSNYIDVPCVIGIVKPVILFPFSYANNLTIEQVEILLAHELSHIKRHDFLINIFQSVVEIVFFFNPFVWAISNIIKTEREHATDDMAVGVLEDKINYIKTLAAIEQIRYQPMLASHFATNNNLITRIKRLTGMKTQNLKDVKIIALLVTAAMIMSFGWFSSQNSIKEVMEKDSNAFYVKSEEDQNEAKVTKEGLNESNTINKEKLMAPIEGELVKNDSSDNLKKKEKNKKKDKIKSKNKEAITLTAPEPQEPPASEVAPRSNEDWAAWSAEFVEKFNKQMQEFEFLSDSEMEIMIADFKKMAAEMDEMNEFEQMNFAKEQRYLAEEQRRMVEEQKRMFHEQKKMAEEHKMEAMEAMRKIRIDEIKMQDDLKKEMEKLEENMKLQEEEMRHLEEEIRIMEQNVKEFDQELTKQLIKDGYLNKGQTVNSIDVNKSGVMKINGEKIEDIDAKRYLKLMEDILGERHGDFNYRK